MTTNSYGSGSAYALGAVVSSTSDVSKNGSDAAAPDTSTVNSFAWYDGAVTSQVVYTPDTALSATDTSTYAYDPLGRLASVRIDDNRARTVTFTGDVNGQVVRRDESDAHTSQGDPHEVWYHFDGVQLGNTGNDVTLDTSYHRSLENRHKVLGTGAFKFGGDQAFYHGAFGQSGLSMITSFEQGAAGSGPGGYTVRSGDSLQSIAYRVALQHDPDLVLC